MKIHVRLATGTYALQSNGRWRFVAGDRDFARSTTRLLNTYTLDPVAYYPDPHLALAYHVAQRLDGEVVLIHELEDDIEEQPEPGVEVIDIDQPIY